jgi:integral membrane sensor domain MASE1
VSIDSQPDPRTPRLVHYVVVPLLYFLAARAAVLLTVQPESTAIVWPPNGVLLATLIYFRMRGYFVFAGLTIVAEAIADAPAFTLLESVLFGLVNVTEATVACLILTRWRFNPRFTTLSDVAKFVAAAPLIAALIAASLAAAVDTFVRGGAASHLEFLRIWWLGDAVGLMIVTPLLLGLWIKPTSGTALSPNSFRTTDALVGLGALCAIVMLIAARGGTLLGMHVGPVLLLPFVIYAAVRYGMPGAALAAAGVALLIMVLTKQGYALFGSLTPRGAVVLAQEFIFITSLLALGPAALISQLRASQTEIIALNSGLEARVRERTSELESALAQVKRLQGLLPVCAWCKKVREDEHYWLSVEDYIVRHTDARFSHGICPECSARVLREDRERTGQAAPKSVG